MKVKKRRDAAKFRRYLDKPCICTAPWNCKRFKQRYGTFIAGMKAMSKPNENHECDECDGMQYCKYHYVVSFYVVDRSEHIHFVDRRGDQCVVSASWFITAEYMDELKLDDDDHMFWWCYSPQYMRDKYGFYITSNQLENFCEFYVDGVPYVCTPESGSIFDQFMEPELGREEHFEAAF